MVSNLIEILKSRLWLILLLPLSAAAIAFFLSSSEAKSYTTHATILLDYRKPLEGELAGELLPVGMQASYLSTQMDIIQSRPVAERVVSILDLRNSPLWKTRFANSGLAPAEFDGWLIGTLRRNLQATIGTETRLIDIWYKDPDPDAAAAIANAFVESYRETIKQLGDSPAMETVRSADKLLGRLKENLERAESEVSSFQARTGIMATDERLDVETQNLNELMRERAAADASLRAAESRLAVTGGADTQFTASDSSSEILSNELVKSLQVDLARKQGELADRSTSLGERHPTMVKLKAEVESLRGKLAIETEKIVAATRGEAVRARRLADAARQAEEAQRRKILELKQVRDTLQPLLRELESARASYDRAVEVYSEFAMHGELSQANLSILSPAQVPELPAPANVMLNVATAFVGGLIFAVGLALLWELADRRVRGKEGIAALGDVGYLGGLPKA